MKTPTLEAHPIRLMVGLLVKTLDQDQFQLPTSIQISIIAPISLMRQCLIAAVAPHSLKSARVWRIDKKALSGLHFPIQSMQAVEPQLVADTNDAFSESLLGPGADAFVVEVQEDGAWLLDVGTVSSYKRARGPKRVPGTIGLTNLYVAGISNRVDQK